MNINNYRNETANATAKQQISLIISYAIPVIVPIK